jgi:hypothetical protein
MRQAIITLAGSREWFATRQSWLAKAARSAGISYRSAKSLFYCEAEDPRASIVESVRAAIALRDADAKAKAIDEFAKLSTRLARLEAAMAISDADFFGPQIDGVRAATNGIGGKDRAVD